MDTLTRSAEGVAGGAAPTSAAALLAPAEPVAAPAADPAPAPAAPAEPAGNWWDKLSPDYKTTVTAKGWDKLSGDEARDAVLGSYVNLLKIAGDKENAIVLPKPDASPEDYAAFTKALGVPEKPDAYEIKQPENIDPAVINDAKSWLHEAGIAPIQAQKLIDAVAKSEQAKAEAFNAQSQRDMNELAAEWGTKFDDNAEIARRAAKAAGLDGNQFQQIEMAIGTKNLLTMFHKFGLNMLEAPAPGTTPQGNNQGSFTLNRAEAQRRADALKADPSFQARYLSPNLGERQKAISELEELIKIAAG